MTFTERSTFCQILDAIDPIVRRRSIVGTPAELRVRGSIVICKHHLTDERSAVRFQNKSVALSGHRVSQKL